jgi:hypothetical protein
MSHATSFTFSKFWSCIILVSACLTCLNSASAQIIYCPTPQDRKVLVTPQSQQNCGSGTWDLKYDYYGERYDVMRYTANGACSGNYRCAAVASAVPQPSRPGA